MADSTAPPPAQPDEPDAPETVQPETVQPETARPETGPVAAAQHDSSAQGDRAFDRLRAADPAHDAEPDLVQLRSAVDARAAVVVDELAARRRPRRGLQVAAAVAGAALIASGGYVAGAGGLGGSAGVTSAGEAMASSAPMVTLGGGGGSDAGERSAYADAPAPALSPDIAPGRQSGALEAASADRAMMPWRSGRAIFTGSGLGSGPATAEAYGFDSEAAYTTQAAASIAKALGVEGTPSEKDGMISVGPQDQSAKWLGLYPDSGVSFNYYDPDAARWYCDYETKVEDGEDPCRERDLGKAPTGKKLTAAVDDFLTALGQDPSRFEMETTTEESEASVWVTLWPVVDGRRSQLAWNVGLTGAGVENASGHLASEVSLGEYAIISSDDAVARLNDPRFGPNDVMYPESWRGDVMPAARDDGKVVGAPTTPRAGEKISWTVEDVTLTKAELGLAIASTASGAQVVVPAWHLSAADGRTWTVLAVADSAIDFSVPR